MQDPVLRLLINSFIDLLYPRLCLCCGEFLCGEEPLFCRSCADQLEVIDSTTRCPLCFSSEIDRSDRLCSRCTRVPSALNRTVSVFDYLGPAATLVKKLKYGNQQHLAEGMAAYMAAQLLQSGVDLPDYLVPIPITWLRHFDRGYNQSLLLAEGMAKILDRPVLQALGRCCGDLSQAGLSRGQRLHLGADSFYLKKRGMLEEKNLLLIDDVMTTGTTLKRCAEVLAAEYPATIRALTFCRAF